MFLQSLVSTCLLNVSKLTALAAAVALSGGLAACGGGGGSTDTSMMQTAQEKCEADGGRYNANGSCSSAAEVQVEELQRQIAALRSQLGLAPSDELDTSIGNLQTELAKLRKQVQDAQDAEDKAELEAAVATAAKLYSGISMPTADDADTADTLTATGTRFAQHAAADGDNAGDIEVAIGDAANVFLSATKTTVADNHGWEGKMYTRTTPAAGGVYEAVVYSNVEDPTMGKKFGGAEANDVYEYALSNGALAIDTTEEATPASRVGGSNFDHSAGVKTFELPDPNPNIETVVTVDGTFHGVSGTFSCTPGANTCAANVAAAGFELGTVDAANAFTDGGGTWMFTPDSAEARVLDSDDDDYASYGWWLHKAANDGDFTASAFVDELGDVPAAAGLNDLNGSATYVGGAAGKYALSSSTGGTNDAGHFTARATLEADFTMNETASAITGTIDMFYGADGQSRDWEVALDGSMIGDTGVIGEATDGTIWTIGGEAADASGSWTGSLRNNGDNGVPQVATGTFYSEFGREGKMVGAFGANLQ